MERLELAALDYSEDCLRIKLAAFRGGWDISMNEAATIWERHSDSYAAGWLSLPEDEEDLWFIIKPYFPGEKWGHEKPPSIGS